MATRMQQRRGTAAQWTDANPILNAGEIGYETDTNQFKIGDGTNHWADLSYFIDETALSTSLGDYVETSLLGVASGVATLNSSGKLESAQVPNIDELAQDAVDMALTAGTGITKSYDDNANTITISVDTSVIATKAELAEVSQDSINDALSAGTGITKTYNDNANTLVIGVDSAYFDTLVYSAIGEDIVGGSGIDTDFNLTSNVLTVSIDNTVVTTDGINTLTNKTIQLGNNSITGSLFDFNAALTDANFTTLDGTETLTNKTISLANNTISGTAAEFNAAVTDEDFATLNGTQTLQNKTIPLANNSISGTIFDFNSALSDADFATLTGTETLTNKSINSANNTITLTANTVTDFTEAAVDAAANALVFGTHTNISVSYDDNAGTIGLTAAPGYTDEEAQDAIGSNVGFGLAYDDTTGSIYANTNALQAKVANVSDTEIGYLDGVTSNVQAQLDAKATTSALSSHESDTTSIHGIANTAVLVTLDGTETLTNKSINLANNTVTGTVAQFNTALSDGDFATLAGSETLTNKTLTSPKINEDVVLTATATELNYVDGVTSNVQAQLDAKAPLASPTFTGNAVFTGNLEVDQNLTVDGNFIVNGSNVLVSATQIQIEDNLLQLAHENANNTVDLGIVVAYNDGTAKHAGIVRDVSDSTWKLFKDVTDEPSTTVNFGQGSLDDLQVAGLTATSLTMGNVTATEFGYLDGVTSGIQSQIDGKISSSSTDTLTNKTVNLANNTVSGTIAQFNTALSDADFATLAGTETLSGKTLSNAIVTGTLTADSSVGTSGQYLESTGTGVRWTSVSGYSAPTIGSTSIASGATVTTIAGLTLTTARPQLTMNAQTGTTYTLDVTDASSRWVTCNNASAITVTVPPSVFSTGDSISVQRIGAGSVTFAAGSGVTITSAGATSAAPVIRAQHASATVICTGSNTFTIVGDII